MNRTYETMFIVKPQLEDEAVDEVIKKIDDQIAKAGGSVDKTEKRGRKRLAYEVKDHRDGNFVLMNFSVAPDQITELERTFKLSEDVIRHIIVRQEA